MNSDDPRRRLDSARYAALLAADYLAGALWDDHEVTAKGAYDLSLTADTEAGRRISRYLENLFPQDFILEEDGLPDPGTSPWVWLIDPLDGTVNYHHKLPWFCVSIACYHRDETSSHPLWQYGTPVASVVRAPVLGQEFWAQTGKGAWCGDRRLHVSTQDIGCGILSHSRGSRSEDQAWGREFIERVGPAARKTRSHGAAALDLAYVAQGSLAAHVQRSLWPWDTAAGVHLVLEAGGKVQVDEGEAGTQHVVAGGPVAYDQIQEVSPCVSSSLPSLRR